MSWKSWLQGAAAAGLLMLGTACTAHWVVASPPRPQTVVVREPPPAPVEVIPPRPGVQYVWVKGHWTWREPSERYQWTPGYWQYTGREARGDSNGRGNDGRDEHARDDDDRRGRGDHGYEGENVHVYGHPPRDREERVPPRPGQDYEWNRGHWVWHQNVKAYEWESGRWERPARRGTPNGGERGGADNEHGRGSGNDHAGRGNGNDKSDHGAQGNGNGKSDHGAQGNGNDKSDHGAQQPPKEEPPRTAKPRPEVKPVPPRPEPPKAVVVKPQIEVRPQGESHDPTPVAGPDKKGERAKVVVFATKQPPKDRVEKAPRSVMRGQVWIGGHWTWQRNDYVWTAGHWAVPAKGFHSWVPGHWAHEARGWYYVDGYWK